MYKLIAIISNHPSPLEENILTNNENIELVFDYPPSVEDVLNKLESDVLKLKGGKNIAVYIKIMHESGATFLEGTASEDSGFSGVFMS